MEIGEYLDSIKVYGEEKSADLSDDEIADSIGFDKCEWGLDESCCEQCGETGKQDYFRRTSVECMDGEYFCIDCIKTEIEMNLKKGAKND